MAHLSWQRCADCGRLVLVRFGSSPECACARTGRGPGIPAGLPSLPARAAERGEETRRASPLALLTPEQDAVARRLLQQALPNGFEL